jgi:hypothetical protein
MPRSWKARHNNLRRAEAKAQREHPGIKRKLALFGVALLTANVLHDS